MSRALKLLFFVFVLAGCASIKTHLIKTPGKLYQGKIWWKLEVIQNHEKKVNGGYAWFCASSNFLVVELKTPFNSELAIIRWNKQNPEKIFLYDLFHKQEVIFVINNEEAQALPLYFLGKKGKKKKFFLFKKPVFYTFSENKGEVKGENFNILWKFKNVKEAKECSVPFPNTKDFKKLVITF